MEALATSEQYGLARYVSEQPPYNLLDRRIENELVPLAMRYDLGFLVWSPLRSGVLAGRYERWTGRRKAHAVKRIAYAAERISQPGIEAAHQAAQIAYRFGLTPSQLGLLWAKDQPGITAPVSLGSRTEAQLDDALPVLEMHLDPAAAAELDKVVPPGSAVADFFNTSNWMKMKLTW